MRINWLIGLLAVGLTGIAVGRLPTRATRVPSGPVGLIQVQPILKSKKQAATNLRAPFKGRVRVGPAGSSLRPVTPTPSVPTSQSLSVVVNGQTIASRPIGSMGTFIPAPGSGAWFNLSIHVPATGQDELFILGIPSTPASVDVPLLVGMRSNNVSHGDLINNTTFWDECLARGWYLLSPLSRGPSGFETTSGPTLNAQINTEAALDWVTSRYPIDMERIYGVGFSAGGATLASYASRHQDPNSPMFAAIVLHTPPVDLVDSYNLSNQQGKTDIANFMGGAPSAIPFEYRRIGSLELDAMQLWLAGGQHAAWNLASIPMQVWYATNDANSMLLQHTSQLFDWKNLNGSAPVSLHPGVSVNPTAGYHNWSVLDETAICNWFDTQMLTPPLAGELMIDRDASYHYFEVEQDAAGDFSRLDFALTLGINKLSLLQSENVQRVTLHPGQAGYYTQSGVFLTLELEALDAGDEVVLEGLNSGPMSVTRDGLAHFNWTYSALGGKLTVTELQTGTHTWVIQF